MGGFAAFAEGFLGHMTEGMDKRRGDANDYFQSQMERAATIGANSLKERKAAHQSISSLTNNLMREANMPEDVVRGLANDGPEALENAYKIYSTSVQSGVKVDEDFWRDAYNFSKEIATDEPLSDFLNKVVGLYPANLQSTVEEGGDPFSAFVSSGLGLNAMDRARTKLETTEVAGGFSARDLINMESAPSSTRPLGDTGYTLNLQAIQDAENAAQAANKKPVGDLDPKQRIELGSKFNTDAEASAETLQNQWRQTTPEAEWGNKSFEDFVVESKQKKALEWVTLHGGGDLTWFKNNLPAVFDLLPPELKEAFESGEITTLPTGAIEAPTEPSTIEAPTPAPTMTSPSVPAEDAPVVPSTSTAAPTPTSPTQPSGDLSLEKPPALPEVTMDGDEVLTFKGVLPNGDVIYTYPNGDETPPIKQKDVPKDITEPERTSLIGDMADRAGREEPKDKPPSSVRVGQRTLNFIDQYDPHTDTWIYRDARSGQDVYIPVQR